MREECEMCYLFLFTSFAKEISFERYTAVTDNSWSDEYLCFSKYFNVGTFFFLPVSSVMDEDFWIIITCIDDRTCCMVQ